MEKEYLSGSELRQYLHISTRKMKYLMDHDYILHEDTTSIGCSGKRISTGAESSVSGSAETDKKNRPVKQFSDGPTFYF